MKPNAPDTSPETDSIRVDYVMIGICAAAGLTALTYLLLL
jgi:hypothetical protein